MHKPQNRLNAFQQIVKERIENTVEIYYETPVHKKFLADVYAIIPKGRKCVIWFTHKQCWMFQIAKRPYTPGTPGTQRDVVLYDDARMINIPFTNEAWYAGQGTIIYGTCVSEKRNDVQRRFSVENVHYLFGEKQQDNGTLDRFSAFFNACAQESSSSSSPSSSSSSSSSPSSSFKPQFQLLMPVMHTNYNDAVRDAMSITTYDVFCIQHRFLNRGCTEYKNLFMNLIDSLVEPPSPPSPHIQRALSFFPKQTNTMQASANLHVEPFEPKKIQPMQQPHRTFIIKPDAQNDIYYILRSHDEPITTNTMIAHIPNYKISVMMNGIFRNIKENRNLDALEESDDEDEEHVPLVDLNKWVRMSCVFSHRFKRWQPVELQPV